MASETSICNRALQKLGAKRITSLDDDSVNARACSAAYAALRDALYRSHTWGFTIARAQLAADATPPAWGRQSSFQLPSDCIRPLAPYPESNFNSLDWIVEGQKILTNDSAPLYLRYVSRVTDVGVMDPLFQEALSCKIAMELAEELTQSNSKKASASQDFDRAMSEAKRVASIERVAVDPPDDTWLTVRN